MTFAVTGANGHLGSLVIEHLIRRGTPADEIVALVRDPGKADSLAARGVEVRAFDYERPDALAGALAGVDALLLISGTAFGQRFEQHRAVIDAAVAAGVGKLVYTSSPRAEVSINPVAGEHKATEEYLAGSGLAHVVLRNGWYHENYLGELGSAAATGTVLTAAGSGRVASAARNDYAEAAAVVLAGPVSGGTFELSGDVAWAQEDLAADLTAVLGREVSVRHVTAEEKTRELAALGLDPGLVGFIVGVDRAIAAGELAGATGELSALIGRPSAPLIDTLRAAA
ncbi:MAG: SDR family oxidoreductase [Propionicimonas sp.]